MPAEILGKGSAKGTLTVGAKADVVVFDASAPWVVAAETLISAGKNTPFSGYELEGRTHYAGRRRGPLCRQPQICNGYWRRSVVFSAHVAWRLQSFLLPPVPARRRDVDHDEPSQCALQVRRSARPAADDRPRPQAPDGGADDVVVPVRAHVDELRVRIRDLTARAAADDPGLRARRPDRVLTRSTSACTTRSTCSRARSSACSSLQLF